MLCNRVILQVAACILLASSFALAGDWPQWRGPRFDGSSDESNLPDKLTTPDNLLWTVDLPGHGAATPIVSADRVYISSVDGKTDRLAAFCISVTDGKILWQRDIGTNSPHHPINNMASPSAIADGKSVYFFFGTGDLAAFDLDGKPLWSRNLQKDHGSFNMQFLYGSSPLLCRGKLYLQVLHRDRPYTSRVAAPPAPSYLLAIDPATGKDLWKQIRKTDAQGEALEAYGTPLPFENAGRHEVVVAGGDYVTGHDADTGQELWRCAGWNPTHINHLRMVPSATAVGDLIIILTPKVRGHVFAIRSGGTGDITSTHVAWRNEQLTSDVCNPLYYRGSLYVLDGDFKKGLSCLDPKTGQRFWFTPITSSTVFRTSPTGADGKIYCMNEAGDVWVLSAADGKILSKTSLGSEGAARGSISTANGRLFIHTGAKLYAFGKVDTAAR